jgi:hypothetical protein
MYLLKIKDEALRYFKIYKAEIQNKLEKKLKTLQCDHGENIFIDILPPIACHRNTRDSCSGRRMLKLDC